MTWSHCAIAVVLKKNFRCQRPQGQNITSKTLSDKSTSRPVSSLRLIEQVLAAVQRSWAFRCTHSNSIPFLSINSSSIRIHLLLMVAHLHLPCPVALPWTDRLNENEANFFHRGSHCAICWAKHTVPLLERHAAVCLERNKSLRAVAQAVLWHYSQQRGTLLMLTNTGERGSFTTHPLSKVPILHRQQRCLSLLEGPVCIQLPTWNLTIYRFC